jgi:benzylsuccinate CoA-transferase BbsF subunit
MATPTAVCTARSLFIDLSQWETSVAVLGEAMMEQVMSDAPPPRIGNRDPYVAPHGLYRCQGEDRWVSIVAASDVEWQQLCRGMGQSELATDPRFATAAQRKHNEDTLEELLTAWTETLSAEEVTQRLQAVGVAAFPALTNKELAEDPHLHQRGFFVELPHPEVGVRQHAGVPWIFSDTPCQVRRPSPCLGQNTDDVMQRVLGYSAADIAAFRNHGVLE